jgi:hypothetical protein
MTALEVTFIILAVAAFAVVAWICGIVGWRLLKVPKR